jgi:hypothetical protein
MANTTTDEFGIVRAVADIYNLPQGGDIQMTFNNRGDQLYAQALPPKAEIVRMGYMWTCRQTAAAAFTHVAALPTTRAELFVMNNEPSGGKCYVIDTVWSLNVTTSMAAVNQLGLIVQIVPAATMVAPTHDATTSFIDSRNGKASYTGNMKRAVAQATGCFTDLWTLLATSVYTTAAATLGTATFAEVWGGLIIPPGAGLGINLVSGIAVGKSIVGFSWAELQLPLA